MPAQMGSAVGGPDDDASAASVAAARIETIRATRAAGGAERALKLKCTVAVATLCRGRHELYVRHTQQQRWSQGLRGLFRD